MWHIIPQSRALYSCHGSNASDKFARLFVTKLVAFETKHCRARKWGHFGVENKMLAFTFRSTDPRPKQWVLLSKTAEIVDLVDNTADKAGHDESHNTNTARLSVTVDASKYS